MTDVLPAASPVMCPYCGKAAAVVRGEDFFKHRHGMEGVFFYRCAPCKAFVKCQPDVIPLQPLGPLANAKLRWLRFKVQTHFDLTWVVRYRLCTDQAKRQGTRMRALAWLADAMNLPRDGCDIQSFDEPQCVAALKLIMPISEKLLSYKRPIGNDFTEEERAKK